jgi:zinc transport system substrate-binding protein
MATVAAPAQMRVFVAIQPQAYFVQRVAGDHVQVDVLVAPGQEPHTFEPTPRQITRLAEAQLFFKIGMPFETRLIEKAQAMNPGIRIVDTARGVPMQFVSWHDEDEKPGNGPSATVPSDVAHGGQPTGEPDPHIWLAPKLAKIQAANICIALKAADPANAADYERNLSQFQADLDRIDARLAEILAPYHGRDFFVFHPAFGYFASGYGLREVPIQAAGKEPGAKSLAGLIDRMKAEQVHTVFIQPQFSKRTAEAIAEATGAKLIVLDDLSRNYIGNLEDVAFNIRNSFAGK